MKLDDKYTVVPEEKQETIIQKRLAQKALEYVAENRGKDGVPAEYLDNLAERSRLDHRFTSGQLDGDSNANREALRHYQFFYLGLLEKQRAVLEEINHRDEFDEELIRKYFSLLDLEEFKLREKLSQA